MNIKVPVDWRHLLSHNNNINNNNNNTTTITTTTNDDNSSRIPINHLLIQSG
jgi:hypothetical protein